MQGVTTAIVGFIFLCLAFPHFVKHKPQFYGAVACVLSVILIDALFLQGGRIAFFYALSGVLQICGIILLILAAGGLTAREFAGEMMRAYEVIRRGEEQKTVIIPLSGQQAKKAREAEEGRVVYEVDPKVAQQEAQASQTSQAAKSEPSSIPLEERGDPTGSV